MRTPRVYCAGHCHLIKAVPYKIHTVLTEPPEWRHRFKPDGGGIQFTTPGGRPQRSSPKPSPHNGA